MLILLSTLLSLSIIKVGFTNQMWYLEQKSKNGIHTFEFVHIWSNRPWQSYQSIKHKSIKRFTVRVLHHNVEEGIQSVLQKLNTHTHRQITRRNWPSQYGVCLCFCDFKSSGTFTEREEMWKAVSFMDFQSKPHAVHFNVCCHSVDAQWQSTKDITAGRELQLQSSYIGAYMCLQFKHSNMFIHSDCFLFTECIIILSK